MSDPGTLRQVLSYKMTTSNVDLMKSLLIIEEKLAQEKAEDRQHREEVRKQRLFVATLMIQLSY